MLEHYLAKIRKEIADSINLENKKKADEWTRLSVDARKLREKNKEDKFSNEKRKRELKEQRKIDAKKKKECQATKDLVQIDAAVGDISTYRSSWRHNY